MPFQLAQPPPPLSLFHLVLFSFSAVLSMLIINIKLMKKTHLLNHWNQQQQQQKLQLSIRHKLYWTIAWKLLSPPGIISSTNVIYDCNFYDPAIVQVPFTH